MLRFTGKMPLLSQQQLYQRKILRQQLRQSRRSLTPLKQTLHSIRLSVNLFRRMTINKSDKVAVYLSTDGEISLHHVIKKLWRKQVKCFLPVIAPKTGMLAFIAYSKSQTLTKNCYDISEPGYRRSKVYSIDKMNIILMPLVGFDRQGNRLGMGGGYYDKALGEKNYCASIRNKKVVGVAHTLQKVKHIPCANWDIKPELILTEL